MGVRVPLGVFWRIAGGTWHFLKCFSVLRLYLLLLSFFFQVCRFFKRFCCCFWFVTFFFFFGRFCRSFWPILAFLPYFFLLSFYLQSYFFKDDFFWPFSAFISTGQLKTWKGRMTCSKGPQVGVKPRPAASRSKPLYMCARSTNWANREPFFKVFVSFFQSFILLIYKVCHLGYLNFSLLSP